MPEDTSWITKALPVDAAVDANRAVTPEAVDTRRAIKRMSISDINDRDWADLQPMIQQYKYDTRGPVTRFLDLIDLPRNTIASLAAPGVAARQKERGELGAFGQGKVMFSDILDSLGMRPGIVRGALGFVGDVAMDPLTYLGGAGAAAKVASTTGHVVEIGRQGASAIDKGIAAARAGSEIADPLVAARAAHAFESLSPMATAAEKAAALSKSFYGDRVVSRFGEKLKKTVGERTAEALSNIAGTTRGQGGIADDLLRAAEPGTELDRAASTAKDFLARYGLGAPVPPNSTGIRLTPKGIAIGNAQSQIGHIPFTEWGVYVPAFTQGGRRNLTNRILSLTKNGLGESAGVVAGVANAAQELARLTDERNALYGSLAQAKTHGLGDELGVEASLEENRLASERLLDLTKRSLRQARANAYDHLDVGTMLTTRQRLDAAEKSRDALHAELAASPFYEHVLDNLANGKAGGGPINADRMLGLRDDLLKGSVAAAQGDLQTAARLRDELRDGAVKSIINMTDDQIRDAAEMLDQHYKNFQAKALYADALKSSLNAQLTRPERQVADIARALTGVSEDAIGVSMFAGPLYGASKAMGNDSADGMSMYRWLNRLDEGKRDLLGNRTAQYNAARLAAERNLRYGSGAAMEEVAAPILERFRGTGKGDSIAERYGITDDQMPQLMALYSARVYQKRYGADPARFVEGLLNRATGEMEPSPFIKTLERAKSDGFMDGKINGAKYGGLLKEIDQVADDTIQVLDSLSLSGKRPGYVPMALNPQAASEARLAARNPRQAVASGRGSMVSDAPFERTRSTDLYQWKDAEGKWHQMTESDFDWAGVPKEEVEAAGLTPEMQKSYRVAVEEKKAFEKAHPGLSPEQRRLYLAKSADPWTANELFRDRFKAMTGGSPMVENLFSDDMLHAIVNRLGQEINQVSRRSMNPIIDKVALNIPSMRAKITDRGRLGASFEFDNGVRGRVLRDSPDGPVKVKVGDVVYRRIDTSKDPMNITEPTIESATREGQNTERWVPEQVAEFVERIADVGKSGNINIVLKAADAMTRTWKSLTLTHPAWPVFNIAGAVWQAAAGRIPLGSFVKHFADSMRVSLAGGKAERLAGREIELAGQRVPLADAAIDAENMIGGQSRTREAIEHVGRTFRPEYAEGIASPQGRLESLRAGPSNLKDEANRRIRMTLAERGAKDGATPLEKLRAGVGSVWDERVVRHFLGPWFAFNAKVEDSIRRAAYFSLLDHGSTPAEAARHVKDTFFDFADMTDKERSIRRYLIPFYSWVRNNSAYQLKRAMQDPKFIGLYPKLQEAIEESIAAEDQVPSHLRPSWMREQLATQIGSDPASRSALLVGTTLPTEPVNQVGGALTGQAGIVNLLKWMTSGVNPIWTVPFQIAAGREFFSGRSIGASPGEGDLSAGEFLANQVRPLHEAVSTGLRPSPLADAAGKGPGTVAGRLLLGGRLQGFDENRTKYQRGREFDEKLTNLKTYINTAERYGREKESMQARVKLLALYQWALENGLEDRVPKREKRRLEAVVAGG